jgi:phage FluMu protein Com
MHCNLEISIVPLELRPGMTVTIPCRHCEKTMIRFTVNEGSQSLSCPRCGNATEAKVYSESGYLRIKTSKGPVRVKPTSS